MSTILLDAIKKVSEDKGTSEDVEIVKTLIRKAKQGDMKAIDIVFDRIEGKAPASLDVTSLGDKVNGIIILPQKNGNQMETTTETGISTG